MLIEPVPHVVAVRDAVAVRDHERRAVVRLRLAECNERLLRIGAHCDTRHVHVGERDRLQRQVLCRRGLTCGGELRHRAEGCRLRHLAAGIRVHLGVEYEHVHVEAARQHVVKAAGADVVGPAVAADDPDTAPDQVVEDAAQLGRRSPVQAVEPPVELGEALALRAQLGLAQLRRLQDLVHQLRAQLVA